MEHRWSIALGATASVSDDLRFVVETDGTGMGTCVYSVETLLKREILRQAERIRELQGELRGKAALGESLVDYKNARITALEAGNRRWMECAGKQFQDLVNLRAELAAAIRTREEQQSKLDAYRAAMIEAQADLMSAQAALEQPRPKTEPVLFGGYDRNRLSRLDALLSSEEPPERMVRRMKVHSSIPSATAAAWRWFREQFR